jgi:hypothetical protein
MFVFVGDNLSPSETLIWEELEKQLTGKVKELKGNTVPSGEKIRKLLEKHQPVILLIDELIEYLIPASGITIGKTSMDSQILSFLKRLSEVVSSLDKTILLVTSPSRTQYSEEDQRLLQLLSERLGRIEKSLTPVEDSEIMGVIRKRLFTEINENEVKKVVSEVVDYFKKENILPKNIEPSEYRDKFLDSYPFLPDVVECFYHRWGSFPTFQRTRGVLRLLSLIIYALKNENLSYISPADINLNYQEIRRELLKHIGNEFDSVIAADITDKNSNSKQVDKSLGASYKGLSLGSRSAITIFLYSFSGGTEKGTSINEIKRSASYLSIPSSVVSEAVDLLKDKLFYIKYQSGQIFFTNQPNLNKMLLTKIENIEEKEVIDIEKEYLISSTKKGRLKTYIWPSNPNDIPDDPSLKLVILREANKSFMKSIIENKGISKRVNRNTIFFLAPLESQKQQLENSIKRMIAFEDLVEDNSLKLTEEQKKDVKNSLRREEENVRAKVREVYRIVYVPAKTKIEELDLGIPTYGFDIDLSEEVFDKLKSEGTIIDRIVPLVLKERYLKGKRHVLTKQIYENSLKTLGEDRINSRDAIEGCIREGVSQGIFGLGEIKDGKEIPVYWKKEPSIGFGENEAIINEKVCLAELSRGEIEEAQKEIKTEIKFEPSTKEEAILSLELPLIEIPKGRVSSIMGLLNYIQSKFDKVQIKINASEGSIKKDEYENKIKEALRQLGIDIK